MFSSLYAILHLVTYQLLLLFLWLWECLVIFSVWVCMLVAVWLYLIQGIFSWNSNGPGGTSGAHITSCEERSVLLRVPSPLQELCLHGSLCLLCARASWLCQVRITVSGCKRICMYACYHMFDGIVCKVVVIIIIIIIIIFFFLQCSIVMWIFLLGVVVGLLSLLLQSVL